MSDRWDEATFLRLFRKVTQDNNEDHGYYCLTCLEKKNTSKAYQIKPGTGFENGKQHLRRSIDKFNNMYLFLYVNRAWRASKYS